VKFKTTSSDTSIQTPLFTQLLRVRGYDFLCKGQLKTLLVVLAISASSVFSLNPIHTAGYASRDREAMQADILFETGGIFRDGDPVHAAIPVAVALGIGKGELGAGLKTNWGGRGDAISHFVLGAKLKTDRNKTLGASLLAPLSEGGNAGLMLEALGKNGLGRRLHAQWVGRLGFMEALAHSGALMAMELSWTPKLTLGRGLILEAGLIGSSQSKNFDGSFSLDLQPGLQVGLGGAGYTGCRPAGVNMQQIIFIDDEAPIREAVQQWLELSGLSVRTCARAGEALALLDADFAGVVVSDVRMPGMDGLALLERLQALDAELPVIMVTGHGDVPMAVAALQQGAYDFIEKPFTPERLLSSLRRALDKRRLVCENRALRRQVSERGRIEGQCGGSNEQPIESRNTSTCTFPSRSPAETSCRR
jgi:CheY-like chemotaxis protein